MGTGAHDYRSTGVHMYEDLITLHHYFTHVIIRSVVGRSETHSDSVTVSSIVLISCKVTAVGAETQETFSTFSLDMNLSDFSLRLN